MSLDGKQTSADGEAELPQPGSLPRSSLATVAGSKEPGPRHGDFALLRPAGLPESTRAETASLPFGTPERRKAGESGRSEFAPILLGVVQLARARGGGPLQADAHA